MPAPFLLRWMHPHPTLRADLSHFVGEVRRKFRTFDAETGELLWQQRTNSGIIKMPVAYRVGDTEYIAFQSR